MLIDKIPHVDDIDDLTSQERRSIMAVYEGKDARAEIEEKVRNVFLWAALNLASDVHVVGKFDRLTPVVTVSVRTSEGLIHEVYDGEHGKFFENKLFQLTGTPQGGSTPQILSSRFEMNLPLHYAIKHGLKPRSGDLRYAVNIRLEYAKTFDGFAFVCRLLDQQKTPDLHELGLTGAMSHTLHRILKEPSGLILVSGPTGSGKTTLLHAILKYLNDGTRAICTVEDPVEYRLGDGSIKQIQVGGDITFPRALRSILRQDPDTILIGEIRDAETMEIAIQAAQTGHLVLSTIHTNSAHETVKFVIAQRLVNRYEGNLAARPLTNNEIDWMVINGISQPSHFVEIVPTKKIGKMAVMEAIAITDEIKMVMRSGKSKDEEIYRLARNQWQYESLASAGVRGVGSRGVLLKDCMESLDTNTDAKTYPGARLVAAREHDLSLSAVSTLVDQIIEEQAEGENSSLRLTEGNPDELFQELKQRTKHIEPQLERRKSQNLEKQ
jgi:Tfp pilus assembly pilus retraction ATPase PilT